VSSEVSRKNVALVKLGAARQSPPDELAQQVYGEGLSHIPSDIVERACQQLAREPKNDYEPSFPPLGIIIERCKAVRDHDDQVNAPKQLREARPEPLSREEARTWVERLRADVRARRRA
jgi:hypothetical protein